MLQCVVNYEYGRIRIYTTGAEEDVILQFSTEENNYEQVITDAGYDLTELNIVAVGKDSPKTDVVGDQDNHDLLDVLSSCTQRTREQGAERVLYAYLSSMRSCIPTADVDIKLEPAVEANYALTEENYPQGIKFIIPVKDDEEVEECNKRITALVNDLSILYDNPVHVEAEFHK